MDARKEFRYLRSLIENEGTKFTQAKDAVAQSLKKKSLPNEPKSIKDLESLLLTRAGEYYETYREQKIQGFSSAGIDGPIDEVYVQIKKDIKRVLQEDIQAYGEQAAIRLNHLLSLSHKLLLSNIFYGRDQSQALTDKLVLSSVKWDIRKPEVEIFKQALVELGYKDSIVEIDNGTFEGGDAALLGNTCFVGVGARTSSSAVRNLAKKIGPLMEEHGIQVAAVVNERHEDEADDYGAPMDEHMSLIHLDMFWIPLEPKLVLANSDELDQRKIVRVSRNAGTFVIEEMGSFRQFHANKGIEIIDVNKQA